MKALMKNKLLEMMKDRRSEFRKIVMESIEEIGLANAIKIGKKNQFVDENKIIEILKK